MWWVCQALGECSVPRPPPTMQQHAGLNALTSLTSLDLSDNPITRAELHPECLPTCLKELVLVGCHLSGRLPPSLTRLTALERFVASTNAIQEADAVFACQHLLHAGLAYNHVSSLVNSTNRSSTSRSSISAADRSSCPSAAAGVLASSRVMCLDLAHNDITDLQLILQQLQQLPTLKALSLKGNPISLLPHYRATVLQQLPQLVYLDGQVKSCAHCICPYSAAAAASTFTAVQLWCPVCG